MGLRHGWSKMNMADLSKSSEPTADALLRK